MCVHFCFDEKKNWPSLKIFLFSRVVGGLRFFKSVFGIFIYVFLIEIGERDFQIEWP